jgi:hypothetical protein
MPLRTCKECGEQFELLPNKPGLATVCPQCSPSHDVPPLVAKVSWEGKHSPVIEITSNTEEARRFNRAQHRHGAAPLSAIAPRTGGFNSDERTEADGEARKFGSGAEPGAVYRTRLGEKHTVKR